MSLPTSKNTSEDEGRPWEDLRSALIGGDRAGLEQVLDRLSVSESVRGLLNLAAEERQQLLSAVAPDTAAEIIDDIPDEQAAELIAQMDADEAAQVFHELDSDMRADLISDMEPDEAAAILSRMDPTEAADLRQLVTFAEDTAGGLMVTDAFSFNANDRVGDVLTAMASDDEDFERFRGQYPYIVDDSGKLVGVVSTRKLLKTRRRTRLAKLMAEPLSLTTDVPLSHIENMFAKYPYPAFPIVDAAGILIGAVTRNAVNHALRARSDTDAMKAQGIIGDELRSMPFFLRSRRRLMWLSGNIVLNVIAASVIAAYEETLAAVIAIAVFLPMVSDMSGCSGNQAVAVSMRELALGIVKPVDVFGVWLKEVSVGALNGVVLGTLIAGVAWVWKGNPFLGLVIGLALAINTVISVSIGGTVPLLLKRLGTDPAVASGPLLTTVTDMAGFFLVLSLATLMMPLLTG